MFKVLITTSGVGSRLGTTTKYTNKSLVTVGNRAAISQIVESYPDDIEMVITLGYYGSHVRDYLTLAYPNKNITFVNVDNYDGVGSSLLYSMMCAKEHLQCPFIFHACDTLVLDTVQPPTEFNWLGGYNDDNSVDYRTLKITNEFIQSICEKGEQNFDRIYIGIAGIKDYQIFWNIAENIIDGTSQQSDCSVLQEMLSSDIDFKYIDFKDWFDIGNIKSLQKARKHFVKSYNILDKEEESLNVFDDYVIKFFHNSDIVKKRVRRSEILKEKVPEIVSYRDNFYKYKKVQGNVLSKTVTESIFKKLLDWSMKNLWIDEKQSDVYFNNCKEFYYDKTLERLKLFREKTGRKDRTEFINDYEIPSVEQILSKIPKEVLCSNKACYYHGDFILENIIYNNGSFTLIDYRQDFAGDLEHGDMYYDIAKMNHNLIFDHTLVSKGLYDISITTSNIKVDILRRGMLCNLQNVLFDFIEKNGLDKRKVELLTPIIWINMSGLHSHPLDLFLYYQGRYQLWKACQQFI